MKGMPIIAGTPNKVRPRSNIPTKNPLQQSDTNENTFHQALQGFVDGSQVSRQNQSNVAAPQRPVDDFFNFNPGSLAQSPLAGPGNPSSLRVYNSQVSFSNSQSINSQVARSPPVSSNRTPYGNNQFFNFPAHNYANAALPQQPGRLMMPQFDRKESLSAEIVDKSADSNNKFFFQSMDLRAGKEPLFPQPNAADRRGSSPIRNFGRTVQADTNFPSQSNRSKFNSQLPRGVRIDSIADSTDQEQKFYPTQHQAHSPGSPLEFSQGNSFNFDNPHSYGTTNGRKGSLVENQAPAQGLSFVQEGLSHCLPGGLKRPKLSIFGEQGERSPINRSTVEPGNSSAGFPATNFTITNTTNIQTNISQHLSQLAPQAYKDCEPPAFGESRITSVTASDFTPDIFQKLRILEEEVTKLKMLNDQKAMEIKALNIKIGNPTAELKTLFDERAQKEMQQLRDENQRLKSRVQDLEHFAFRQKNLAKSQSKESDYMTKIILLERENHELREQYRNFKEIANNGTYQDLETYMKKILEMEGYIKDLKRKNERLEAQLHS